MASDSVRWMISFWHSAGGSKDDPDFPRVDFWHPDRESARAAAARVLIELREDREDERDWVAAGHPDPLAVGSGRHPGGQWLLRYRDIKPPPDVGEKAAVEERLRSTREVAGAWKDNPVAEDLSRDLENRRRGSVEGQGK